MISSTSSRTFSEQIVTLNCHIKMIGKTGRGGEKFFERGSLGNFAFLRFAAVAAGVEILVEERADIKFVKGIGLRLFQGLFPFRLSEKFRRCSCR